MGGTKTENWPNFNTASSSKATSLGHPALSWVSVWKSLRAVKIIYCLFWYRMVGPDLHFSEHLLKRAHNCESFLCPSKMYLYLLQLRSVFLIYLKAIPLRCGPLSPVSVATEPSLGAQPAADTAGLVTLTLTNPLWLLIWAPSLHPHSPLETPSHLCANQKGVQLFPLLSAVTE